MEVLLRFEKTGNPIFTEGKDLQGNMPTMPRTDSMFDRKEDKRPAEKKETEDMAHGQKHTGHARANSNPITQPGTTFRDGLPNVHIWFDSPGDFQRR